MGIICALFVQVISLSIITARTNWEEEVSYIHLFFFINYFSFSPIICNYLSSIELIAFYVLGKKGHTESAWLGYTSRSSFMIKF